MITNGLEKQVDSADQSIVGIDKRIPFKEKIILPVIGALTAFFNLTIQYYLLFFYTNYLNMVSGYLRSMFVIVQILAAVIALAFATCIDRHATKLSRYKIWLLIVLIGTAFGAFLAFVPIGFGGTGNLVYATVAYAIFNIFFSMNFALRIGMTTAMTKRQDDRIEISICNSILNLMVTYAFSYITIPLMSLFSDGNAKTVGTQGAYFKLILLLMIVFAVLTFFLTKNLKERFFIPIARQAKHSFKLTARSFFKNKYALIAIAYTLIQGLCLAVKSSTAIYYFMYIVKDTNKMAEFVLLTSIPVIAGMFFSPFFTKMLGIKKNLTIMLSVNILTSAAAFFVPSNSTYVIVFFILSGIGYFCLGISQPTHEAMLSAAADYGEWKFDSHSGAFLGALSGLMQRISSFANRLLPVYLGIIGFVSTARVQSSTALTGIKFSATFLPALLFLLLLIIVLRWDMTLEKHKEVVDAVYKRYIHIITERL